MPPFQDSPPSRKLHQQHARRQTSNLPAVILTPPQPLLARSLLDAVLAFLLLLGTLPLMLLAALLVKLTSHGPAFYSQVRLGLGGRPFRIFKLRTMTHDCERLTGPQWSTGRDTRVTLLGLFLRTSHLDELPQLWNILKGDMSLVGPRPERPEFVSQLAKIFPFYQERHLVKPGLTGLAQVQLPPDSDLVSVRNKLALDLVYVQNQALWLDVRILLATGLHLLGGNLPRVLRLPTASQAQKDYARRIQAQARPASKLWIPFLPGPRVYRQDQGN